MKSENIHSCVEGVVLFLNKVVGFFTERQIPTLLKSEDYRKKTPNLMISRNKRLGFTGKKVKDLLEHEMAYMISLDQPEVVF